MAVKTEDAQNFTTLTVRVDYSDVAGGFAGWFLHTIHQLSDSGIAVNDPNSFPSFAYDATNKSAARLHKEVQERLASAFGAGRAVYLLTLVQSVTPAVVDDDF